MGQAFTSLKKIFLHSVFTVCIGTLNAQEVGTYLSNNNIGFEAITWSTNGNIYTVDFSAGKVYKITPDQTITQIADGFENVAGGGIDAGGNFYFSDFSGDKIFKVNPDDSIEEFATGGLDGPVGLQLSPDSTFFYVVNYNSNTLKKISLPDGTVSGFVVGNGINGPDGIVLAPNGDVIVANFNNDRLHRVTPDGEVSLFVDIGTGGNMGYVTRVGAYYYVATFDGHTVHRIDEEGNAVRFAGTGIGGIANGPANDAQFVQPNGITANPAGDTLIVSDGTRLRFITNLDDFVSSSKESFELDIKVYPSVFQNKLFVEYTCQLNCEIQLRLLNLLGKVVSSQDYSGQSTSAYELDDKLGSLNNGAYFLQIWEGGELMAQKKVLKQN